MSRCIVFALLLLAIRLVFEHHANITNRRNAARPFFKFDNYREDKVYYSSLIRISRMRLLPVFLSLLFAAHVCAQSTVTLTDFQDYQVIQRTIGAQTGSVAIKGTYTGTSIASIDAKVDSFTNNQLVVDWQTIAGNTAGNTFSGTLTVPQGGWYKVTVQGKDGSGTVLCSSAGTHKWGVGINVLAIGQSNMVGNGNVHTYTAITTDLAGLYSNHDDWRKCKDPYDTLGNPTDIDYDSWYGASMIPAFVNSLSKVFSTIPIGIVPAAKGSTPLHAYGTPPDTCWVYRDPADHARKSTLYGNSLANARAASGAEFVIMHQGETDATFSTSEADYRADLQTLLSHYREDLNNPNLPLFLCQLACSHTDSNGVKHRTDSSMQRIRNAQYDSDDSVSIFLAALCIDVQVCEGDDHYYKPAYDTIGERLGNAVKHYYFPSTYPYYRGPAIRSAQFGNAAKTKIDVFIAHRGGTDFTTSGAVSCKGFVVYDNGAPVTVGSTVKSGAACITLNTASPVWGTGLLRYLYGKQPDTTGIIHDNTPLQLPLEPTTTPISITAPTITVTSPNGAEVLMDRSSHIITWLDSGIINVVTIEYSIDNGSTWRTIATCPASQHSYSWTAPDTTSTTALVRISDAADAYPTDQSDAVFTLAKTNNAPTDIALTSVSVDEQQPAGTVVGTLSTTDPDAGQSFTYTLVSGPGSTDNGCFTIFGNALKTGTIFDFETRSLYSIRLRTADNGYSPLYFEKTFVISVRDINEAPASLSLSNCRVTENCPAGTVVGALATTDPDAGQSFTYSLASGAGSIDNSKFTITGNQLKSAVVFDHESQAACSIRIRTLDNGTPALSRDSIFLIAIADTNEAPTDMSLSGATVNFYSSIGTTAASLSAVDQDSGETFTYSLVSGTGSTDNAQFQITGDTLKTAAAVAKAEGATYAIRIGVIDHGGLIFEKACAITVTVSNHAPTDITLSPSVINENCPAGATVGALSAVDIDAADGHSYSLVPGAGADDNFGFTISGNQVVSATIFNHEAQAVHSIRIRVTDSGSPALSFEKSMSIAIANINEPPTDIALKPAAISERLPIGALTGLLSAVDPDSSTACSFQLASGEGADDNARFAISHDSLKTAAVLDYETKSSLSVRVRAIDNGTPPLQYEKALTVTVINVNEQPIIVSAGPVSDTVNLPLDTAVNFAVSTHDSDTPAESLVTGWYFDTSAISMPLDLSAEGLHALTFFVWDRVCDTVRRTWILNIKERIVPINDTFTVALPATGRMRASCSRGERFDITCNSRGVAGKQFTFAFLDDSLLPAKLTALARLYFNADIAGLISVSTMVCDDGIKSNDVLAGYDTATSRWHALPCSTAVAPAPSIHATLKSLGLLAIADKKRFIVPLSGKGIADIPAVLTVAPAAYPRSARLAVRVGIPQSLAGKPLMLSLYSLRGGVLARTGPTAYSPGWRIVPFKPSSIASGFCICEVRAGDQMQRIKLMAPRR